MGFSRFLFFRLFSYFHFFWGLFVSCTFAGFSVGLFELGNFLNGTISHLLENQLGLGRVERRNDVNIRLLDSLAGCWWWVMVMAWLMHQTPRKLHLPHSLHFFLSTDHIIMWKGTQRCTISSSGEPLKILYVHMKFSFTIRGSMPHCLHFYAGLLHHSNSVMRTKSKCRNGSVCVVAVFLEVKLASIHSNFILFEMWNKWCNMTKENTNK